MYTPQHDTHGRPDARLVPIGSRPRIGTFVKTNAVQVIELLGLTSLDFVVIDAEHAPFDRADIDLLVLAGRAAGLPTLVRAADSSARTIGSILDAGADGLLLPYVESAEQARELVARTRCLRGERGFSSSTRAAGYGALPMAKAVEAVDQTFVMAQIESAAAVEAAEAIAAVDGIDGLFVGRADLALSFGEVDARSGRVLAANQHVLDVARAAGKAAGMAVGSAAERDEFAALGANWFLVGSDQSLLRQAAQAIALAG
jgi:2-keto-3-deoxy-L-rhamnonate aldolase RhmA